MRDFSAWAPKAPPATATNPESAPIASHRRLMPRSLPRLGMGDRTLAPRGVRTGSSLRIRHAYGKYMRIKEYRIWNTSCFVLPSSGRTTMRDRLFKLPRLAIAAVIVWCLVGPLLAAVLLQEEDPVAAKMSDDIAALNASEDPEKLVPVIVHTVSTGLTPSEAARLDTLGGDVKEASYLSFRGYSALVPAGQLDELAAGSDVLRVSPDRMVLSYMDVA